MKISDLLRFSVDNLRRRIGRTMLTIIGVVVGVCAIVVMVSLGIAVSAATDEMISSWGDLHVISIYNYSGIETTNTAPTLDDSMIENFANLEHVVAATPEYQPSTFQGTAVAGNSNRYKQDNPTLTGIIPSTMEAMEYNLLTGRYPAEVRANSKTIEVVVSANLYFYFYDSTKSPNNPNRQILADYPSYEESGGVFHPTNGPQYDAEGNLLNADEFFFDFMDTQLTYQMQYGSDPATGEPNIEEYNFEVVGVLDYSSDYAISESIVMPVSSLQQMEDNYYRLSNTRPDSNNGYNSVKVKVDDIANMPDVEKYITDLGYQIISMSQQRDQMQAQVMQTQMMLGGLAAVSLFVAALNIANTMTMAIYERTREIGVMKVLGCKLSYIRAMFLIESGTIGFLGGLIGILFSFLISLILNYLPLILSTLGISSNIDIASMFGMGGLGASGTRLSIIEPWLVFLALGFATSVGLLSGLAPANRAMKISSLEAIRHD